MIIRSIRKIDEIIKELPVPLLIYGATVDLGTDGAGYEATNYMVVMKLMEMTELV